MECVIEKLHITTVGEGASRRVAEQQAAQLALEAIK
jgi:ribonuclease-3